MDVLSPGKILFPKSGLGEYCISHWEMDLWPLLKRDRRRDTLNMPNRITPLNSILPIVLIEMELVKILIS